MISGGPSSPMQVLQGLAILLSAGTAFAGVYLGTADCTIPVPTPPSQDFCVQGKTRNNLADVHFFGVTHPPGYSGAGGSLEVKVCVEVGPNTSSDWIEPTKRAISTWNALKRTTGNCQDCRTVDEPGFPPPDNIHAESLILHELGHCAMGLGHPNLFWRQQGATAFGFTGHTMSYGGSNLFILDSNGIKGDCEDEHEDDLGDPAVSIHWFRDLDNDPVKVDATVIDDDSYSVRLNDLPSSCVAGGSSTWPANANHLVADQLGLPETQSVMHSRLGRKSQYLGLAADDVNMFEMGMTGNDWQAELTTDNYVIDLQYVSNCTDADIKVFGASLGANGPVGDCSAKVKLSFPPPIPSTARHYTVVDKDGSSQPLEVRFNTDRDFNFEPAGLILMDGFESGNTSAWSSTVP